MNETGLTTSFWRAARGFFANDGFAYASHIALSILLAIFPFLIVVTALAGFVGDAKLANTSSSLLLEFWPEQVSAPIIREITHVLTSARADLLTLGSVLALYFSSNSVEALRASLNRAYGVTDLRPWWKTRLQSIFFVVLGAISAVLLALLIVFGPLLFDAAARSVPALTNLRPVLTLARFCIAVTALTITLGAIHLWLPAGRRRIMHVLPGIGFTIIGSIAAGVAFGEYLSYFINAYVSTYAGLSSPIIALVYLNYTAIVFIFGGELNAALMAARSSPSNSSPGNG